MQKYTPLLFFVAAALFALNGLMGILSSDGGRSACGLGLSLFWLIIGVSVQRKYKTNRA
jgi:hypothetical protein